MFATYCWGFPSLHCNVTPCNGSIVQVAFAAFLGVFFVPSPSSPSNKSDHVTTASSLHRWWLVGLWKISHGLTIVYRSFIFFTFSSQSIHLHKKLWDLHFVLHRDHLEETTSLKNCGDVMDLKLGLLKTEIARCGWTVFSKANLTPQHFFDSGGEGCLWLASMDWA